MAYDEGSAELMAEDIGDRAGISQKKMFGGLCYLLNGNMLCGVHKDGGMYRVGKDNYEAALEVPGAMPLSFTGRPMGGMVEVTDEGLADDAARAALLKLALDFVGGLPAK